MPQGRRLPDDRWRERHRWMLRLLWAHAVGLSALGLVLGYGVGHSALHAVPIALCGLLGGGRWASDPRRAAVVVSVGLLTCSALLVHVTGGMIEAHFHFFVMISVLTLYEDWLPFLTAVAYVVFHHGVVGTLAPHDVYNHPGNPWALTALHAVFVAGAGAANVLAWRLNEAVRGELRDAYDRTRLTLDTANEAYVGIDERGVIVSWNLEAAKLFGWSREQALGRPLGETIVPERLRDAHREGMARFLATRQGKILGQRLELSAVSRDGREFPIEMTVSAVETPGRGWLFNAFLHDITERKAAEAQLHRRASQQAAVADFGRHALEGTPVTDVIRDAANLVARELEVDMAAVLEYLPGDHELIVRAESGEDRGGAGRRMPAGLASQAGATLERREPIIVDDWAAERRFAQAHRLRAAGTASGLTVVIEGRRRPFGVLGVQSLTRRTFSTEDVSFVQAVANTLAVALERWESEEQVRHNALHDPLTGLPNRALFLDRLRHALARGRRAGTCPAVLFVDLDDFKLINDSLGHAAGDVLLQLVAPRLSQALRTVDTVARFGGDELIVLCEEVTGAEEAVRLCERVLAAFEAPFALGDDEVFVTASVGIALGDPGSTPDSLVRDADAAMYRAKARGPAHVELFDDGLREATLRRLRIENALRRAVDRGEMRLAYQPVVLLDDGSIRGLEALLRWEHPELGHVSPAEFIPVAEQSGLIVPIGKWVLEEACHQAARWKQAHPDARVVVSVNVSAHQLVQRDFVAIVDRAIEQAGADPGQLLLEITESVLMQTAGTPLLTLEKLRDRGIAIDLDDFGSGYSSLGYIDRIPFDALKLDRAFVAGLEDKPTSRAIFSAVVAMAATLELPVVAEGVETEQQAELVRSLGCNRAQGYHFARPMPAEEIDDILARRVRTPTSAR